MGNSDTSDAMASHGNEGKTRAAEPAAERKTTQCQGERKRKRESNVKMAQQRRRPQEDTYYSRTKQQLLNTAEPSGRPGSEEFRNWNPPSFRRKIDWLADYGGDRLSVRCPDWRHPDFIKSHFHPQQQSKLWDLFRRNRKGTPNDVQVRDDKVQNLRPRRQLMAAALFGPPGQWIRDLEDCPISEPVLEEDEAASEEKKRRKEKWYYLEELEEMFGQQEAHELIANRKFKKRKLRQGDMYSNRHLTDAANRRMQEKKRRRDEDYSTIQEGMKQSKEADRVYIELDKFLQSVVNLRARLFHGQARLNSCLATEPPNSRKIKEATSHVGDLCTVLRIHSSVGDLIVHP